MRRSIACCLAAVALIASTAHAGDLRSVQTGDVIFQESQSAQSAALKRATGSRYTHVGLVVIRQGEPWVIEAVQPVRWTRMAAWIDRGVDDHAVVMRLHPDRSEAVPWTKVVASAEAHLGKPYDPAFVWSDDRLYCSELVYKAYRDGAGVELAPLRSHKDYDLSDASVQRAIATRYPDGLPQGEPVIAPSDLMASPRLREVARTR